MALSENAKTMFKIIQDATFEDSATTINKALLHAMQLHLHVTDEERQQIEYMTLHAHDIISKYLEGLE